jgi:hypothetical protein
MKSKNKTKKKIILAVLIIALLSLGAAFWYVNRPGDKSKIEVSEATKKQTEQNDAQQAKSLDNKNSNQSSSGTSTSSSSSAKPSLDITTAEQVDDRLIVSALVSNTSSGTCNLTLKNGSSVISKFAPVGQQVSYYVCQGFIINSSEISPKGDWDLTIKLDSPNGSFETPSRKIGIK